MGDNSSAALHVSKPRRLAASAPPHPHSHPPASPSASRPPQFLSYMHRPPRIVPNYGKRPRGVLPKSSVSRVLLYDNVTQEQMLHVKVTNLGAEQRKTGRLMDMHRKSFITRRQQKERQMAETALHVDHDLLEQGLLSANLPRSADSRARPKPTFNPYLDTADDSNQPHDPHVDVVEHHVTSPSTDGITAEDAMASTNGQWAEARETPLQFLAVDRQRAATSQCLVVPQTHPTRTNVHRASHTAKVPRETMTKGQGGLPDIHVVSGHVGRMLVDSQQHNGLTRILHTLHHHQDSVDGGGRLRNATGGGKVGSGSAGRMTEDERYRKLERLLVRIEPPNEGYLELSPSFHSPRQSMTFTRPSSFHPSLYRRRSSSAASSALS